MIISADMDLGRLAECMGGCYGEAEAREMRALLVAEHNGQDTRNIADDDWSYLVETADVRAALGRKS